MSPRFCAGAAAVVMSAALAGGCGSSSPSGDPAVGAGNAAPAETVTAHAGEPKGRVLSGTARRLTGGRDSLSRYRGDVVLVVNTASQCGYTPQFAELQELYASRARDGFVILGFPSDSFDQELDDAQAIKDVCEKNFGVKFPMFAKTAVTGEDANPLFKRLAAAVGEEPKWNFNKYLVDRRGRVVGRFDSGDIPVEEIDRLLSVEKS
jgi:glutathione peroxidase